MPHNLGELKDEELAGRALAGASSCFEELVRRYQVPLLRFLLRRARSRPDAEDLLQETFLRAYRSLGAYSDAWPVRTWLFTIAHRLAISHVRKRRGRGDEALAVVEPAGNEEPPGERLDREEEGRGLWETAGRVLSEEQFGAVWLHYVEGLAAREIARVLGRTRVGIKTMLFRARRTLLAHLPQEGAETRGNAGGVGG